MTVNATNAASLYSDTSGLTSLKKAAAAHDPTALREAARQFESLFTRMMLKSMRDASPGDSMFDSQETNFYRDMYDDQLAVHLSSGKGMGLADMLVQQLARSAIGQSGTEASVATAADPLATAKVDSSGAAASTAVTGIANSPEQFVQKMLPYAQEAAAKLGVDPRTLIAHAALETGWGRSVPTAADGTASNNLFGIKAGSQWSGDAVASRTLEFEDGIPVSKMERFRAYATPAQSFEDYATLLSSSARYAEARDTGSDFAAFADALQQGGYATDPAYAQKLSAVVKRVHQIAGADAFKVGSARPIAG